MFERPLAQGRFLCLHFFFSIFSTILFMQPMIQYHEGYLSQRHVRLYTAKNQEGFFHSKCCTMVRSVSSQEGGQITVTLFLLLHHFFLPSSFERLFSSFLEQKTAFFYLIVFIMTFHLNSSFYRKTNVDSSFPLNVPMACLSCNKRLVSLTIGLE
jgi:hypothetical protein